MVAPKKYNNNGNTNIRGIMKVVSSSINLLSPNSKYLVTISIFNIYTCLYLFM